MDQSDGMAKIGREEDASIDHFVYTSVSDSVQLSGHKPMQEEGANPTQPNPINVGEKPTNQQLRYYLFASEYTRMHLVGKHCTHTHTHTHTHTN